MAAPSDLPGNSTVSPPNKITLPIRGPEFSRPDPALIQQMYAVSSATASALLNRRGIRHTFLQGPVTQQRGAKIVGSAVTLQFMPQREDVASGVSQEYAERSSALWHVLDSVEPGDVLAVQAYGDPYTGCLGEMLINYFKVRGGVGIVIDGYLRDWPKVETIGVPIWARGTTPNYASQSGLFPWGYNVPINCAQVLVLPGDILIADDDGAVVVPATVAPLILQETLDHEDWEAFSRMQLEKGGSLWKYYPLSEEGRQEYEVWKRHNQNGNISKVAN